MYNQKTRILTDLQKCNYLPNMKDIICNTIMEIMNSKLKKDQVKYFIRQWQHDNIIMIWFPMLTPSQGQLYSVPIQIFLPKNYPHDAPLCYLEVGQGVGINQKNTNIDMQSKKITVLSLTRWNLTTSISTVLAEIQAVFSKCFPIYKLTTNQMPQNNMMNNNSFFGVLNNGINQLAMQSGYSFSGSRNNDLLLSLKNIKNRYDQLNIEMNKYESTFKKLIYLIKYILKLYPNNNNIQNKIIELQLESLFKNYEQNEIKVSDLMTEEQNERNEKLLETLNKMRDIEDMKTLIDNFKIESSSDNLKQIITEKMKRINELTEKYEKLDNDYIDIKAKYNNLIAENNEEILSQKKRIKIFETQVSNLSKDKIQLKNEIDILKEKINNLEHNGNY